jgi:hypothetical protein
LRAREPNGIPINDKYFKFYAATASTTESNPMTATTSITAETVPTASAASVASKTGIMTIIISADTSCLSCHCRGFCVLTVYRRQTGNVFKGSYQKQ